MFKKIVFEHISLKILYPIFFETKHIAKNFTRRAVSYGTPCTSEKFQRTTVQLHKERAKSQEETREEKKFSPWRGGKRYTGFSDLGDSIINDSGA